MAAELHDGSSQVHLLLASQVLGHEDRPAADGETSRRQRICSLSAGLELPRDPGNVRGSAFDLDGRDQIGIREEQIVALVLRPAQGGSGSVEVDDEAWSGGVRQRCTATALDDDVDQAGAVFHPGLDTFGEALHSVSPRASATSTHSLCSAVATASNPEG